MLLGLYVLKAVLETKDVENLNLINKEYLIDEEELKAFNSIMQYVTKYGKLPPPSSINVDLEDHPLQFWLDSLEERYTKHVLNRIKAVIDNTPDPFKSLDIIKSMILNNNYEVSKIFSGNALTKIIDEDIKRTRENLLLKGIYGIPSGWKTLDKATGGYTKGDVFVFSARAKVGKTMLMCYSISNIVKLSYKVLIVSMEMTKEQILKRIISVTSKIPYNTFRSLMCSFAENKIKDTINLFKDNLYIIEGHLDKSLSAISTAIASVSPDIVFIDGAYMIKPKRERQMWEEVTEVVSSIKKLALQYEIPIVCSYQLRRMSSSKENLGLEHLALADTIGQIASCVIGIVEPEIPYHRKIELIALRDGQPQDFFINWDWKNMNFNEIGGDENVTEEEEREDIPDIDDVLHDSE